MLLRRVSPLILLCNYAGCIFDEALVKEFFKVKHCTMVSLFTCITKKEQMVIAKNFMESNLRLSMFNVITLPLPVTEILKKQHYHIGVIVDIDCEGVEEFLIECANNKFFYETYHWLAFSTNYNATTKFQNVGLAINTDLTVVLPTSKNNFNWTLLDVYNPYQKRGGDLKVKEVGFYNKKQGYNTVVIWNKHYDRRNMTGTTFSASMVIPENITIPLEDYLANDAQRNNNTFSRFNSVTVHLCQDFYMFKMNKSITNSWGYIQKEGDIDGLTRQLKYGTVDFGIAALLYRAFRLVVVDYGYGSWRMRSAFIFRHPKSTSSSSELYYRPLDGIVWILIMVALVFMVVILRFVVVKKKKLLPKSNDVTSVGESSWSFIIIYNIGELCQQGFSYIPTLASGRIAVLTVLLFFFLIYQFYSASIVSFLLLPPKRTITTLSDLLKSSLHAGVEDVLYDTDYLKTTTDPLAIALYNTKIKQPLNKTNFLTPQAGLDLVKKGGYAFHTQLSTGYPMVERQFPEKVICELAEVPLYKPVCAHMALSKKSPLREMFMYCNVHQMEVGIINHLRNYWDAHKPQCVDFTPYLDIGVGLNESYWVLLLWGFGVFVSVSFLMLELLWKRLSTRVLGKTRRSTIQFL